MVKDYTYVIVDRGIHVGSVLFWGGEGVQRLSPDPPPPQPKKILILNQEQDLRYSTSTIYMYVYVKYRQSL